MLIGEAVMVCGGLALEHVKAMREIVATGILHHLLSYFHGLAGKVVGTLTCPLCLPASAVVGSGYALGASCISA